MVNKEFKRKDLSKMRKANEKRSYTKKIYIKPKNR